MLPATTPQINMKSAAIVSHFIAERPSPEARPVQTECTTVREYLAEAEARKRNGWPPNAPSTLAQRLEAYRRGLWGRPAPGALWAEYFDAIDRDQDSMRKPGRVSS